MTRGSDAIDYAKQVADVGYDVRLVPKGAAWAHRPLDIVSRWSAAKSLNSMLRVYLARPAGLEPATTGLEVSGY